MFGLSRLAKPETPTRLATLADIADRYRLPGPHVTLIMLVPVPGTVGDDFDVRWSATRADLRHMGVSDRAVQHLDSLIRTTIRRGHPLLITANDDSAASCWLGFDIEASMETGELPALVPALRQLLMASQVTVAAVVDREGADLYAVGTIEIGRVGQIAAEDGQIQDDVSGRRSPRRGSQHSEVIIERNAASIAAEILRTAEEVHAGAILLAGDDRVTRLVEDCLTHRSNKAVVRRQVGGRHEPKTVDRVRVAALYERRRRAASHLALELARLREELGQHDRAIEGAVEVLEAITDGRVGTLFVDTDADRGTPNPPLDVHVRAALDHGARLVVGPNLGRRDGVAALLRVPYT